MINDILTVIKSRLAIVLPDYYELDYVLDLDQNSWNGTEKRWGVIPSSSNQFDGINRAITQNQTFEVILTESWMTSQPDDVTKRTTAISLQENAMNLFMDLIANADWGNVSVVNVFSFQADKPDYTKDGIVSVLFEFTIQYRRDF